jgi:hypothetical protein
MATLKEMHYGEPQVDHGSPSLSNTEMLDNINADFAAACKGVFITPYKPFLTVKRILAQYHVLLPNDKNMLFGPGDEIILPISQFGTPESSPESGFFLYFAYAMDENGYECYAELTNEEGLKLIMSLEGEEEDEEETE